MTANPLIPLPVLVVGAIALAAFAGWSSWISAAAARRPARIAATALRVAAVVSLAVIACNFGRYRGDAADRSKPWVVMVDRSASMATRDIDGGDRSRWTEAADAARRIVEASDPPPGGVVIVPFGDSAESSIDPERLGDIRPEALATDITRAGAELLARYPEGVDGIVLISDGRQSSDSATGDFAVRARAMGAPVVAVPLGGEVRPANLSVTVARRSRVAFPGQVVRIEGEITARGLEPIATAVKLAPAAPNAASADAEPLAPEQDVTLETEGSARFAFEIVAPDEGYHPFRVVVPKHDGESDASDNETSVAVTVLGSQTRLFMAEGVPYWDSKFLAQLLREEASIGVASVYRVAADRFFKVETELARASESSDPTFPDSDDEIAAFDAVVFGKGAEYFLNPERIELLERFVRDRGGSLIFSRGKPYASEFPGLAALEPITWGDKLGRSFRLEPTEAGAEAGLFGPMLPDPQAPVWASLPPLEDANQAADLQPFAQVMVEGVFDSGGGSSRFPAVVARQFGRGIIVVVNADGLWRWDFFPTVENAENMYAEFWTQLVLWAVTYSEFLPGHDFSLRLSHARVEAGAPVRARVTRRAGQDATVAPAVRLAGSDGDRIVPLAPRPGEAAAWETIFTESRAGDYRVSLVDENGDALPGPSAPLTVRPPPSESDNLSADPDFLSNLAAGAGGRVVSPNDLDDAVADAVAEKARQPQAARAASLSWSPAWDRAWLLMIVLGFFAGEWFIRRREGLL